MLVLGTAAILAISSSSLSAMNPEDLADKGNTVRVQPASQGWGSYFRQAASSAFDMAGDVLRSESNTRSSAGKLQEFVKDSVVSVASAKIGVSLSAFKDTVCSFLGNGLRTVGSWIRGSAAPLTPEREFLNNSDLSKFGVSDSKLRETLKAAEQKDLNLETVAKKIGDRGYAGRAQLHNMDLNEIQVEVSAEKALKANAELSYENLYEKVTSDQKAGAALLKMKNGEDYLKRFYEQFKLEKAFNEKVKAAAAA
jgi:hypothetical protein